VGTEHIINRENCNMCGQCVKTCPASAFEIKGTEQTAEDVFAEVIKDLRYYEKSGGGMTVSGGEPLAHIEFTKALLMLAKDNNIHTCVETSGFAREENVRVLLPYVDLWLFDYKASGEAHKKFAGVENDIILRNLKITDEAGGQMILRCPIVPTCNDNAEHFAAIAQTANSLQNIVEINVMPYHPMGESKANRIGQDYPLKDVGFPEDETVQSWLQEIQAQTRVQVRKG